MSEWDGRTSGRFWKVNPELGSSSRRLKEYSPCRRRNATCALRNGSLAQSWISSLEQRSAPAERQAPSSLFPVSFPIDHLIHRIYISHFPSAAFLSMALSRCCRSLFWTTVNARRAVYCSSSECRTFQTTSSRRCSVSDVKPRSAAPSLRLLDP